MTWGTPTCLGHLIRDEKKLMLICTCGQEFERDPVELQTRLTGLGGYRGDLADLNKSIMCGLCGRHEFSYEVIAA